MGWMLQAGGMECQTSGSCSPGWGEDLGKGRTFRKPVEGLAGDMRQVAICWDLATVLGSLQPGSPKLTGPQGVKRPWASGWGWGTAGRLGPTGPTQAAQLSHAHCRQSS